MRLDFVVAVAVVLVLFSWSCGDHPAPAVTDTVRPASIKADTASAPRHDSVFVEPDTLGALPGDTAAGSDLALFPHPIHLDKGVDLTLSLPKGYHIGIAAQGLRRLRFMAKSPDGRLFTTAIFISRRLAC
jgi:hypothetical protein